MRRDSTRCCRTFSSSWRINSNFGMQQLGNLYPPLGDVWAMLGAQESTNVGRAFEGIIRKRICGDGSLSSLMWFYPGLHRSGRPASAGINCKALTPPKYRRNLHYPDFVISEVSPRVIGERKGDRAILVGDIKLSGNSLYNQYIKGNKADQFHAITRFAGQYTYTRTAAFLTAFSGQRSKLAQVRVLLVGESLKEGVVAFVIAAKRNKNYFK